MIFPVSFPFSDFYGYCMTIVWLFMASRYHLVLLLLLKTRGGAMYLIISCKCFIFWLNQLQDCQVFPKELCHMEDERMLKMPHLKIHKIQAWVSSHPLNFLLTSKRIWHPLSKSAKMPLLRYLTFKNATWQAWSAKTCLYYFSSSFSAHATQRPGLRTDVTELVNCLTNQWLITQN